MPIRATNDTRLRASDYRTLLAVSQHDRMTKDSAGCYASQETLAKETGHARKTVADSLKHLTELGYLTRKRTAGGRRWAYKIAYEPEPLRSVPLSPSGDNPLSPSGDMTSCNRAVTQSITKHVPLSGEEYSAEAAHRAGARTRPADLFPEYRQWASVQSVEELEQSLAEDERLEHTFVQEFLSRLERLLKQGKATQSDRKLAEALFTTADSMQDGSVEMQQVLGHAERIHADFELAAGETF